MKLITKDFVWNYEEYGDPEMCGIYDLLTRKWWLYSLKDGRIDNTISKSRREFENKLSKLKLRMAKKMYHHSVIKWPLTGKTLTSEYQYLVY